MDNNNTISNLSDNDLIFYKDDDGKIISGGYSVNSMILNNKLHHTDITKKGGTNIEKGGTNIEKGEINNYESDIDNINDDTMLNVFENLAVPVGIYYESTTMSLPIENINEKKEYLEEIDNSEKTEFNNEYNDVYVPHTVISSSVYDELLNNVEVVKKRHTPKKKGKKQKKSGKKTRKTRK